MPDTQYTKYDLERFIKNNETIPENAAFVRVPSNAEYNRYLYFFESHTDWKWCVGDKPTDGGPNWRDDIVISFEQSFGYLALDVPSGTEILNEHKPLMLSVDEAMDIIRLKEHKQTRKRNTKPEDIFSRIILPEEKQHEIVSVLKQHDNRDRIFNEWGLGEFIEYGKGMIFLFHGDPGTGKTFTARLMADVLGLTLKQVDVGELQSAMPGEFQRNLKKQFDAADPDYDLLLFDEADSFIQSRRAMGQIMSGENNAFLQHIEHFEGIVVLTTNRIETLDRALERRLSLILEFPHPTQAQRKLIWQRHLPKQMPVKKNVNLQKLSTFNLTGGQIKNAVLSAARYAVSDNRKKVGMEHFERAIDQIREGHKAFSKPSKLATLSSQPTKQRVKS